MLPARSFKRKVAAFMRQASFIRRSAPPNRPVVTPQLMGRAVGQFFQAARSVTRIMSSGRLGAILALGVVVVGSQPAEGQQQRLLVLPFEIGAPQDSAISQELAAIVREQLVAALIGEIRVVPESQRASAYQAAGFAPKAIVSRVFGAAACDVLAGRPLCHRFASSIRNDDRC